MRATITTIATILITLGLASSPAWAASQQPQAGSSKNDKQAPATAVDVVKQAVDNILKGLDGHRAEMRKHPQQLRDLIDQNLLPIVDVNHMAKLALGRPWLKASTEQKQRFIRAFKAMVIRTYSGALINFKRKNIEFLPLKAKPDAKDVTVRAKAKLNDGSDIPVTLDMHRVDGQWKIYNGAIGNLSFVLNYRAQFRQFVHNKGLEALIEKLEKRYNLAAPKAATKTSAGAGDKS